MKKEATTKKGADKFTGLVFSREGGPKKTESHILEALEKRHGQQTTILIAHRLSSTRLADRIYVFDHGRIVQSGTHEELLNMEGSYQRLWSIQGVLDDEINAVLSGDES